MNVSNSISKPPSHLFISVIHFLSNLSVSILTLPSIFFSFIYPISIQAHWFFFLLTSSPFFLNICIFFFLSMLSQFYQGKGISKSVSMNCGPCQGMSLSLKALSHSDSYTWAMENRRPSNARSLSREGSVSSLGSQEVSFSDICSENCTHTESQVWERPIINIRLCSSGSVLQAHKCKTLL